MKTVSVVACLLLGCVSLIAVGQLTGDEPRKPIVEQSLALELERLKTATEFGEDHPRVRMLDKQIELVKKHAAAPVVAPADEVSASALLKIVQLLEVRVESLENEVAAMKNPRPKVEFLGR